VSVTVPRSPSSSPSLSGSPPTSSRSRRSWPTCLGCFLPLWVWVTWRMSDSDAIRRLSTEELIALSARSKRDADALLSNLRMMTAELRLRLDEAKDRDD
jgi:hypothetical protein